MMGKVVASAIGDDDGAESHGPPVSVLVVKLLDLVKLHDEHNLKHGGHAAPAPQRPRRAPAPKQQSRPAAPAQARPQQQRQQQQQTRTQPQRAPVTRPVTASAPPQQAPTDLMDFGNVPAAAPAPVSGGFNPKVLHHATSSPGLVNPNETRAQRLKREQEERMKKSNRVWDDIDQRWVEVDPNAAPSKSSGSLGSFGATSNAPPVPKKKEVGIKLDMSNAAGKSADVQRAIHERVSKMEESRHKAVAEVKQREAEKKRREEEEDLIRQQLEPKIKAWSEEHGKKKQLQALLASLHTILWPGAKWKQISIGDVLDASKCKKFYFKATLVVHPDKTHDLPGDQRFLAKRIFDALTQAKTIWDESNK
jgi:hypothetical protein